MSLVQGPVSANNEATSNTVSAAFGSAVSSGSMIIACLASYLNTGFTGVTGLGATWTQVARSHGLDGPTFGNNDENVEIWIGATPTSGATGNVTATAGTNTRTISITIYEVGASGGTSVVVGPALQGPTFASNIALEPIYTGPSLGVGSGGVVIAAGASNIGSGTIDTYLDTPSGWVGETSRNGFYIDLVTGLYLPSGPVTAQQSWQFTNHSVFSYVTAIVQIGGTPPSKWRVGAVSIG